MSIPGLIYTLGSLIAVVIIVRWAFREDAKNKVNTTVADLFCLVFMAFVAGLASWVSVLVLLIVKYEDVVVIKRKDRKEESL